MLISVLINTKGCHVLQFITKKTMINRNALKQHYVTLTAAHCFEKRNLTMHADTSHKAAVVVKLGHIFQRKCHWFSLCCSMTALSVCSLLF